jgi:hypothetical protein
VFDLKRPCMTCPFRKGHGSRFRLPLTRLQEIGRADAFQCHKTVDYDGEEDEDGESTFAPGDRPQQCAGLMALLHYMDRPNQIMRVAERLGTLDPTTLDPENEAYATWADALRAHRTGKE